jgi:opacity protein-like surface antigen
MSRKFAIHLAPLAVALWLFAPATAGAQEQQPVAPTAPPIEIVEPGAWTITPYLGTSFGGNLENSPLSLGFASAYNWTPRVAFEGELGYLRRAQQGVPIAFDTNVLTGNLNVLYHFAADNFAPYATVGLGFGHARADWAPLGLPDETSTELMLNYGGGVKMQVADRTNLRLGLRYFNGNDLVPDFWRPYVGLTFNLGPAPIQ